jgi:antitoxin component of RelBE/YafQ-DinJ toxin-antitoxin module
MRCAKTKGALDFEEKLYSENVPNAKTLRVFQATEEGKGLNACEDVDDLIKKLGTQPNLRN